LEEVEIKNKLKSLAVDNRFHKVKLRMINKKIIEGSYSEEFKKHRISRREVTLLQEILRLRRELRRKEAAIEILVRSRA
jgi:hypothetical protein